MFVRTVHRFGYAFCGQISDGLAPAPAGVTCWIVWKDHEVRLNDGENIIGRDPGLSVRLDLPSVSRRHARIVVSSTGATVEDLGSKNGTFLRGERVVGAAELADGDEIAIGSVVLLFRAAGSDATTETGTVR